MKQNVSFLENILLYIQFSDVVINSSTHTSDQPFLKTDQKLSLATKIQRTIKSLNNISVTKPPRSHEVEAYAYGYGLTSLTLQTTSAYRV